MGGRVLALDVGLKRIGIAYAPEGDVVIPLEAVLRKNREQAAAEVKGLLENYRIETLVIGLPKGGSSEAEMERRIRHFAGLLEFKGDVVFEDEYGSSHEAVEQTKGLFRHKKDGRLDSMAAKIILERWLGRRQ